MKYFYLIVTIGLLFFRGGYTAESIKDWEVLKRSYSQAISKSEKRNFKEQIISRLASISSDEIRVLSSIPWFWSIIIEDVAQAARQRVTRALSVDTLGVLVEKIGDSELHREQINVPKIISVVVENLDDHELVAKLPALIPGVAKSAEIGDAIRKRLVPLRLARERLSVTEKEITSLFDNLASQDAKRRAALIAVKDASSYAAMSASEFASVVKDASQLPRIWTTIRNSSVEVINQLSSEHLEILFRELTKDSSYRLNIAAVATSHLEIAKGLIRKLDAVAPEFFNKMQGILRGVGDESLPLDRMLSLKAKDLKGEMVSELLAQVEETKQNSIRAREQTIAAQKKALEDYNNAINEIEPQSATNIFWFYDEYAKEKTRNKNLLFEDDKFVEWLISPDASTHADAQKYLARIATTYLSADDEDKPLLGDGFRTVLSGANVTHLLSFMKGIDDEERIAVVIQLLAGEDKMGTPLINKYWSYELKSAGIRGQTEEELALRRLVFAFNYLSDDQINDSVKSDAFWGLMNTYPAAAAMGLTKDNLVFVANASLNNDVHRKDLPQILARIVVRLNPNRVDIMDIMLRLAHAARDSVLAEALIQKWKAAVKKTLLIKNGSGVVDDAEKLLMETIKSARKARRPT